jgi:hypothetical protein
MNAVNSLKEEMQNVFLCHVRIWQENVYMQPGREPNPVGTLSFKF